MAALISIGGLFLLDEINKKAKRRVHEAEQRHREAEQRKRKAEEAARKAKEEAERQRQIQQQLEAAYEIFDQTRNINENEHRDKRNSGTKQ